MSTYDIVAERGYMPDGFKLEIDGILIGKVLLCLEMDFKKPLCFPAVFKEDGMLKFRVTREHVNLYGGAWPVIGYEIVKKEGFRIVESRIFTIGLMSKPNFDPHIRSVEEQVQRIRSGEKPATPIIWNI